MILRRLFLALVLCATAVPAVAQDGTRLIILRHADRFQGVLELNEIGRARAAALPGALADLSIDAIFISGRKRNVDSAIPLANARGLEMQVIEDPWLKSGSLGAEIVRRQPTGTSVWIGNTGNLRVLWDELKTRGTPPLRYGEIHIVDRIDGVWRLTEKRTFEP